MGDWLLFSKYGGIVLIVLIVLCFATAFLAFAFSFIELERAIR